ncbi:MAG: right-handed parallel beta-helix repeat-containing protein, partial [Kiritimatiellae bacterium]|nr:right-handed parallel beta-helix repeat-containing protein [Kiritimatiellia bacterium]
GGGGGSGSYLVVDDWDDPDNEHLFIYDGQGVRIVDEWTIRGECGGAGGGGKVGGRGGDGKPESLDKGTKGGTGKSHKNYSESTSSSKAGDGAAGGNGGEQGAGGRLYVLPSVGFSASPYRASDALDATAFVNFLEVDVTLDLGLTDASGNPVTTTFKQPFAYGMKPLDDIEVGGVNPRVKRAGYRFAGYWTTREGDGTCVYGPDYKPTMVMSPYTKDFTLYARWEVAPEILSVTSSGDAASTLGVYGNTAITLRDAVQALIDNPLLVGTDGRRRVTFEELDASNKVVRLAREIVIPAGVRSFEINGLYELEPGEKGIEIVAGPNARHLNYDGKSSDGEMFSLANLNFTGGSGSQGGSIRALGGASLSIEACSFIGNTSPGQNSGGAIAFVPNDKGSELFVSSSTFAGNSAPDRHGGAVYVDGAYALFVNTTFSGNTSGSLGGGILEAGGAHIDLLNCTFTRNLSKNGCSLHSADSRAVVRAVNCIFADDKNHQHWGAVSMTGGTLSTYWSSMDADPAKVFTSSGNAVEQVVAGVTHVVHPPLGGAAAGNEDAAEIYHDPDYLNVRAVGRDGTEVVLEGNRDDAKIPFVLDQLQSVRTAPTRGAVRLAVGTAPVTVELDGVLLDDDGTPRANETVTAEVTVSYSDGEAAPTNMVIKTMDYGIFGLSVPVDGSDGLAHNVTGVKVDALGPDPIAVTMAPYALTAGSVELLGSNDYVPLYGDAIAIGNLVAQSISVTNSIDARAAGSFTAGELKGFGQIDLEHVAVAGGTLDWMGGKLPAAQSDAFADIAEMTVGGGADADAVGTISGSAVHAWKAAGDGFFQLQARCQNPAGTTLKLELLDANGSPVVEVTPNGALGDADGLRRFLWTVPVRGGDSVRLTMSAGELTLVKGQFIYFGVPE